MNVKIWAHDSLDGASSALAIKQLLGKDVNVSISNANYSDFPGLYKGWYMNSFASYDKIFILGFSLPTSLTHVVDHSNVIIINNESTELVNKQAKVICNPSSSCISLIQESIPQIKSQTLYNIADDYTNQSTDNIDALKLNAVYFSLNQPRIDKFIARFMNGFDGFNIQEKNAIKLYFNRYKEIIDETDFFSGLIKNSKVVSCFADYATSDIARYAIKNYSADIVMVINMEARLVFFFKNADTCDIGMDLLASKMCDGTGRDNEACGVITKKFLEFTKQLIKCK